MHYHTVFDASQAGYTHWHGALQVFVIGVIFLVAFVFLPKVPAFYSRRVRPAMGWIGFILCTWVSVASFHHGYAQAKTLRDALAAGRFVTVTGRVTDYVPLTVEGHHPESFRVGNRTYSFYEWDDTGGYVQTFRTGSVIKAGEQVRITDVDGVIARLEVAP